MSLRLLLTGGDRRSIARVPEALALARGDRARTAELAELARDADPLVAMRALDILDKLAHENPAWVQPHAALFVGPLAGHAWWEVRLQIVRTLPLLDLKPRERKLAVEILILNAHDGQKFVRAWALDGVAAFAERDRSLNPVLERLLEEFERSGSPALRARARQVRRRIAAAMS